MLVALLNSTRVISGGQVQPLSTAGLDGPECARHCRRLAEVAAVDPLLCPRTIHRLGTNSDHSCAQQTGGDLVQVIFRRKPVVAGRCESGPGTWYLPGGPMSEHAGARSGNGSTTDWGSRRRRSTRPELHHYGVIMEIIPCVEQERERFEGGGDLAGTDCICTGGLHGPPGGEAGLNHTSISFLRTAHRGRQEQPR